MSTVRPFGCRYLEPLVPANGSPAERFQVMLVVDEAGLAAGTAKAGTSRAVAADTASHSHLEDGMRVSAETSRRICCDAGVSEVRFDAEGHPLDVGRRRRTIPPALRQALELRDQGCRLPGCPVRHFTAGHHVIHWADGGETKLDNLLLLCGYHHRLVHEGGWTVRWQSRGNPIFFDPRGWAPLQWAVEALGGSHRRVLGNASGEASVGDLQGKSRREGDPFLREIGSRAGAKDGCQILIPSGARWQSPRGRFVCCRIGPGIVRSGELGPLLEKPHYKGSFGLTLPHAAGTFRI